MLLASKQIPIRIDDGCVPVLCDGVRIYTGAAAGVGRMVETAAEGGGDGPLLDQASHGGGDEGQESGHSENKSAEGEEWLKEISTVNATRPE